jgi:hypothetical protein
LYFCVTPCRSIHPDVRKEKDGHLKCALIYFRDTAVCRAFNKCVVSKPQVKIKKNGWTHKSPKTAYLCFNDLNAKGKTLSGKRMIHVYSDRFIGHLFWSAVLCDGLPFCAALRTTVLLSHIDSWFCTFLVFRNILIRYRNIQFYSKMGTLPRKIGFSLKKRYILIQY